MKFKVQGDEEKLLVYLEITSQELEKSRKYLIWLVFVSLPLLASFSTVTNFIPPGLVHLPPSQENHKAEK